jgi:3-hydroxyisobutyrate dehydrogenase-like beta-hydroxyacid dehydrogenase
MTADAITVLGLGSMGRALAARFAAAGHSTTAWNRTPGREVPGADVVSTVEEAVAASPLVVACLLDDDAVHQVLDPVAGTLAGRTLVNLTTSTPAQARARAEWAAGHGVDYLDGGILAAPEMLGEPGIFVLYSGSPTAFALGEKAFAVLGEARYLGEDPGRAALFDLALLSAMYTTFAGYFHAAALVAGDGVPATELTPLVSTWLTSVTGLFPAFAADIDAGTYDDSTANMEMQVRSYQHLLDVAGAQGVRQDVLVPMHDLLVRAAADRKSFVDLLRVPATEG